VKLTTNLPSNWCRCQESVDLYSHFHIDLHDWRLFKHRDNLVFLVSCLVV
jgi:hypothetical protein